MISVAVLFFATLRDRAGISRLDVELPEGSLVSDLKSLLSDRFPDLAPLMSSTLVAVNHEYADGMEALSTGDEVAFFPPVSGGSRNISPAGDEAFPTIFLITEDELDLDDLLKQISLPTTGAACFFTGMVRASTTRTEPHETVYLEYQAYRPMAEAKMDQVAQEIRQRWPSVEGIAIVQRIGVLYPGTPTVLIACTAAHRDTGVFEAARYGIDRLKEIVPIWKKEVGPGGKSWVEGDYYPKAGE